MTKCGFHCGKKGGRKLAVKCRAEPKGRGSVVMEEQHEGWPWMYVRTEELRSGWLEG